MNDNRLLNTNQQINEGDLVKIKTGLNKGIICEVVRKARGILTLHNVNFRLQSTYGTYTSVVVEHTCNVTFWGRMEKLVAEEHIRNQGETTRKAEKSDNPVSLKDVTDQIKGIQDSSPFGWSDTFLDDVIIGIAGFATLLVFMGIISKCLGA